MPDTLTIHKRHNAFLDNDICSFCGAFLGDEYNDPEKHTGDCPNNTKENEPVILIYRVFDCEENQTHCPGLVGLSFLHWPAGCRVVEIVRIPLE